MKRSNSEWASSLMSYLLVYGEEEDATRVLRAIGSLGKLISSVSELCTAANFAALVRGFIGDPPSAVLDAWLAEQR